MAKKSHKSKSRSRTATPQKTSAAAAAAAAPRQLNPFYIEPAPTRVDASNTKNDNTWDGDWNHTTAAGSYDEDEEQAGLLFTRPHSDDESYYNEPLEQSRRRRRGGRGYHHSGHSSGTRTRVFVCFAVLTIVIWVILSSSSLSSSSGTRSKQYPVADPDSENKPYLRPDHDSNEKDKNGFSNNKIDAAGQDSGDDSAKSSETTSSSANLKPQPPGMKDDDEGSMQPKDDDWDATKPDMDDDDKVNSAIYDDDENSSSGIVTTRKNSTAVKTEEEDNESSWTGDSNDSNDDEQENGQRQQQQLHLVVLGERHSGVERLQNALQECYPDSIVSRGGGKRDAYWFQDGSITATTTKGTNPSSTTAVVVVVVGIFRDPYNWLETMRLRPLHAPSHWNYNSTKPLKLREFATKKWTYDEVQLVDNNNSPHDDDDETCQLNFHPNQVAPCLKNSTTIVETTPIYELNQRDDGAAFANIMELRRAKIQHILSEIPVLWNTKDQPVVVNYEMGLTIDVLKELQAQTGQKLPDCAGDDMESSSVGSQNNTLISKKYAQWMLNNVDWEWEAKIGYHPRNVSSV